MWLVYALLASITAALVAVFGKLGLKGVEPILATTLRSVVMMVFLILTALFLGKFKNFSFDLFDSKGWLLIVLAGISGALSWLFYFFALKYGLAYRIVAVDRLSLVFVLLLATLFLGEALSWKSVFGALLMIAGAFLVIL